MNPILNCASYFKKKGWTIGYIFGRTEITGFEAHQNDSTLAYKVELLNKDIVVFKEEGKRWIKCEGLPTL